MKDVNSLNTYQPADDAKESTMPTIEHKGKSYEIDHDGFLLNPPDWDENWVEYIKNLEGLPKLSENHLKIMDALRVHFKSKGYTPKVSNLSKCVGFSLTRIYELFPSGPGKGACRMAGVPKPSG